MKPMMFFMYRITIKQNTAKILKHPYILLYTVWLTEECVFKQLFEIEVSVLNIITIIRKLFYVFCTAGMEVEHVPSLKTQRPLFVMTVIYLS